MQRRRLAGTVRPDQADDLAASDLERQVAHGCDAAVGDIDAAKLQHGRFGAHAVASWHGALTEIRRRNVEVGANLVGRPLGEHPALVEHEDAVADVHDQRHVVIDQQDARLVVVPHRADDGGELGNLGLGQPGGRLVHQHEQRLHRERPGDSEPALVPVRERSGRHELVRAEAEDAEELVGRLPGPARALADAERGDLDVLAHRQRAERVAVLERAGEAAAAAPVGAPRRDHAVVEDDRAGRGEVEAAEQVDEGRLARAVRADQAHHLVAVQLERDTAEGVDPLERAGYVGGPEGSSGPPTVLRVLLELGQSD